MKDKWEGRSKKRRVCSCISGEKEALGRKVEDGKYEKNRRNVEK